MGRRRQNEFDPERIFEQVRDGFRNVFGRTDNLSEEERLLERRKRKWRAWRGHRNTFFAVNGGLAAMNLVLAIVVPPLAFPWAAFPAIGWGVGLVLHRLSYRSWLKDNARELRGAEAKLGLAPPAERKQLAASLWDASPEAMAWQELLERCRTAVQRAEEAMDHLDSPAARVAETKADLQQGLQNVEHLSAGARKLDLTLAEIAPGGLPGLDKEISALDRRIVESRDERAKEAHLENRALLLSRRAKVEALLADRERMRANAEGFLLAADNLRLDAARLGGPESARNAAALAAPLNRLSEEVDVLRRVEAELARLG